MVEYFSIGKNVDYWSIEHESNETTINIRHYEKWLGENKHQEIDGESKKQR